jgi:hypothetical protein
MSNNSDDLSFDIFSVILDDFRIKDIENCNIMIKSLLNETVPSDLLIQVNSPDYGVHKFIGIKTIDNVVYFVSEEFSFLNENLTSFKFTLPLSHCDTNSLIQSIGNIMDLIKHKNKLQNP